MNPYKKRNSNVKKPEKCLYIIRKIIKRTGAQLYALLGSSLEPIPGLIGKIFEDADGVFHMGLFPVAILKAREEELIQIRHNALELENTKCIDLTNVSQE